MGVTVEREELMFIRLRNAEGYVFVSDESGQKLIEWGAVEEVLAGDRLAIVQYELTEGRATVKPFDIKAYLLRERQRQRRPEEIFAACKKAADENLMVSIRMKHNGAICSLRLDMAIQRIEQKVAELVEPQPTPMLEDVTHIILDGERE
jgi:hypothetical protein